MTNYAPLARKLEILEADNLLGPYKAAIEHLIALAHQQSLLPKCCDAVWNACGELKKCQGERGHTGPHFHKMEWGVNGGDGLSSR